MACHAGEEPAAARVAAIAGERRRYSGRQGHQRVEGNTAKVVLTSARVGCEGIASGEGDGGGVRRLIVAREL